MPDTSNRFTRFWSELKRRKVTSVVTVYAATAFVILEVTSIIVEPLRLPDWTLTLVIVLLSIGFPVTVIFSWIYDFTPEGLERTGPPAEDRFTETRAGSSGWRIASFISFAVILGLVILQLTGTRKRSGTVSSGNTIAVLPFHNFSPDPEQEYMCLGLTDEIINHLYKVESFKKVSSLTSVLTFRDTNKNSSEIADELGVNYILEGTYRKIGDQLKVSAQLIEPRHDRHIWQNEYERPYSEIITLQSDIALDIADQIHAFISREDIEQIRRVPTTNQAAYEKVQQAILAYNTNGFSDFEQLAAMTKDAIRLDPGYADAYAWAGIFTLYQGIYAGNREITTTAWEALPYLEKAIRLDESCGIAHLGMGNIFEWVQWDFVKADQEYRKARIMEPNPPANYFLVADFYRKMQFPEKETGEENLVEAKQYADNLANQNRNTDNWRTLSSVGYAYLRAEAYDSAQSYFESALRVKNITVDPPSLVARLAISLHKNGQEDRAYSLIKGLEQKSKQTSAGSPDYFTGWFFSNIGEVDSAFYWLEVACENRSPELPHSKADPAFDILKQDDRYWDLYERTGHKAWDDYMKEQNHKPSS